MWHGIPGSAQCASSGNGSSLHTVVPLCEPLPKSWPEHLDEAICQMNDCILPALNAIPRELLFRLPLRPDLSIPLIPLPTSPFETHTNFTLTETFLVNAHLLSLEDAECHKASFNTGNLVQVYNSASDFNYHSINKLAPKWSEPRIIHGKFLNSFLLCTLSGIPLKGLFHSCRLWHYIPLRGTTLDTLYPWEETTPSNDDLEITEAEERMVANLYMWYFWLHQGTPGWSSVTPMSVLLDGGLGSVKHAFQDRPPRTVQVDITRGADVAVLAEHPKRSLNRFSN